MIFEILNYYHWYDTLLKISKFRELLPNKSLPTFLFLLIEFSQFILYFIAVVYIYAPRKLDLYTYAIRILLYK